MTWKHEVHRAAEEKIPAGGRRPSRRGAEAVVTFSDGIAAKQRQSKRYRAPALDKKLIAERTRAEARLIHAARRAGVPTPVISDITHDTIVMERIPGALLTESLSAAHCEEAGRMVGMLHTAGIMHGDLTSSNMILRESNGRCVLIDFGLAQATSEIEQRGVDIHVMFQTLSSTNPKDAATLKDAFTRGYRETFPGAGDVISREEEIELRGRYL